MIRSGSAAPAHKDGAVNKRAAKPKNCNRSRIRKDLGKTIWRVKHYSVAKCPIFSILELLPITDPYSFSGILTWHLSREPGRSCYSCRWDGVHSHPRLCC